ncbi:hypothetical protein HDU92_007756 [Lobulomyces angularis]|nr:hypothetical protein HDU92_007756 [Lobulomyces angularis]
MEDQNLDSEIITKYNINDNRKIDNKCEIIIGNLDIDAKETISKILKKINITNKNPYFIIAAIIYYNDNNLDAAYNILTTKLIAGNAKYMNMFSGDNKLHDQKINLIKLDIYRYYRFIKACLNPNINVNKEVKRDSEENLFDYLHLSSESESDY